MRLEVFNMRARSIRGKVARLVSRMRISYLRFMGVTIGEHCFISRKAFIDIRRGKIVIGDYVSIAPGSFVLSHAARQPIKEGQVTKIEDNVLILVSAVVFPGVTVGKNSIIGAGSMVTHDVPPNVTVFGNPARVIWPKGNRPRKSA